MGLDKRAGRAPGPGPQAPGRFTAAGSILGVQYQIRYALLRLLRAEPGDAITIEKTDDIALERGGAAGEWVQTKHHTRHTALGDTSPDLWKTLRNWSSHMLDGSLDPRYQTLMLVTTGTIRDGTAASMLCPGEPNKRDVQKALELLAEAARKNRPASNAGYYAEFAKLGRDGQSKLLQSVNILGSEPDVEKIKDSLKKELRLVSPQGKLDAFVERVEGWWFDLAIDSMSTGTPIRFADLEAKITDIRNQFGPRSLPADFANAPLPPSEKTATKTFVKQLEIIDVLAERQEDARLDYYRAYNQRSKWTADDLVMVDELPEYDKRLTGLWSDLFHRMKEDLAAGSGDEQTLRARGRAHYNATIDKDIRIRPGVSDPYVMRGSLHMLADKLEIGWHPNYDEIMAPQPGEGSAQ